MEDEKRRKIMMVIAAIIAVGVLIGVTAWIFERSYYKDQPFTFSQMILLLLIIPVAALLFAMFFNPKKQQPGGVTPGSQVVAPFPEVFTTVVIPWQGRSAIAIRAPSVPIDQMRGEVNDFTPAELLANIEIVDASDQHTVLTDFDPPVELEFKFPATLIDNARKLAAGREQKVSKADDFLAIIQVGFWDGSRWVLFTPEKHNFRIQGNDTYGYVGKVDLKKWGDPPIGWSPPH